MTEKSIVDSKIYTDIQGLSQLKYDYRNKTANSPDVKKEVAQQFEAILMQMVLHSMRDASKAFSSDLFGSNQMEMYQDMFDKQLSLLTSSSHTGFAELIEKNINTMENAPLNNNAINTEVIKSTKLLADHSAPAQTPVVPASNTKEPNAFATPEEFIKKLWSQAKVAANYLGLKPEVLLAQAALETNWGKNILQQAKGISSHNLFNIKADSSWKNKTTTAVTSLEQKNGILVKEKSSFRSYTSFKESFSDYVNFLKSNNRYTEALAKAADPKQFAHALQQAGYATDQNYAEKIMKIFSSQPFKAIINKLKESS